MAINFLDELKKGNTKALDYFINLYEVKLTYFCLKYTGNTEVADEIISDTFHKLWLRRDKIQTISHLESFLFKVTKNACINMVTRGKEHLNVELDLEHHDRTDDRDAHQQIVLAELMEMLYQEIDKLPPQQAAVFKLSFLEGLTTDEICDRLNTGHNTVFNAKSMALKTLRAVFKVRGIDIMSILFVFSISRLLNNH